MICSDLEDIRKRLLNLQHEKNEVLCKNETLQFSLNEINAKISQMEAINKNLLEQLKKEDSTVMTMQDENIRLKQCLRQKKNEIGCLEKIQKEMDRLDCEIAKVDKELINQKKENGCLEDSHCKLVKDIIERKCNVYFLRKKITNLESEVKDMEYCVKSSNKNENLHRKVEEAECNLQTLKEEYARECAKLKKSEFSTKKVKQQIQCLKKELCKRQQVLAEEKCYSARLQKEKKQVEDERCKLMKEWTSVQERTCEMRRKMEMNNNKLRQAQRAYKRVQREYQEFKYSIEEFKRELNLKLKGMGKSKARNYIQTVNKMSSHYDPVAGGTTNRQRIFNKNPNNIYDWERHGKKC